MAGTTFERPHPATLSGILDIVADAVIILDTDQRIVFFNRGAEEIFGWRSEDIMGQSLHALLPSRSAAIHDHHLRAFVQGLVNARLMGERQEVFGRRRDGSEFPAEVSISKLVEADRTYLTAIVRDVTERKRHERSLREAMQVVTEREAALTQTAAELRASRTELPAR